MKERPILFSAPMVRALLAGTKTQTRRVVKNQERLRAGRNDFGGPGVEYHNEWGNWQPWVTNAKTFRCPYGQPGDRLWVRETFAYGMSTPDSFAYKATSKWSDFEDGTPQDHEKITWKPSIHMPRWASRLTLEVTAIRVERLQDISEGDATKEGIGYNSKFMDPWFVGELRGGTARQAFLRLWESINGPGSWDANPWVWVVEFRRVKP